MYPETGAVKAGSTRGFYVGVRVFIHTACANSHCGPGFTASCVCCGAGPVVIRRDELSEIVATRACFGGSRASRPLGELARGPCQPSVTSSCVRVQGSQVSPKRSAVSNVLNARYAFGHLELCDATVSAHGQPVAKSRAPTMLGEEGATAAELTWRPGRPVICAKRPARRCSLVHV